jgi:hypothetical protein
MAALSNGRPDDLWELAQDLMDKFNQLQGSQPLLRACVEQSELPLYLR